MLRGRSDGVRLLFVDCCKHRSTKSSVTPSGCRLWRRQLAGCPPSVRAYNDKGQPQDACQALAAYLKTPAGKTPEQQESRKDGEAKKFSWKCP